MCVSVYLCMCICIKCVATYVGMFARMYMQLYAYVYVQTYLHIYYAFFTPYSYIIINGAHTYRRTVVSWDTISLFTVHYN